MSVGLVLITHDGVGRVLLDEAETLLGRFETRVQVLGVGVGDDPETTRRALEQAMSDVDEGEGALLMTDVFGATPSNIAHRREASSASEVVHGLNLAMLMRAHNYAHLPLADLVEKIIEGGKRSIFAGEPE